MSRMFRFVHLSDIHFGQEGGSLHGPHQSVRREIIRDCGERFTALGKADGILVNGDVAFSGKKEQFDRSAEWIEELAAVVGCSEQTDIRVIPGNHDVDRTQIDYFCETAHERLRGIAPDKLDAELAKMAKAKEESNPLLAKLQNYRVFASRYGCDFDPVERLSWRKTYEFDANHRFEILGLTSVLVCDGNDAKDKMLLGSNQYIFDRRDGVEFLVMVHHPLSWFKDQHDAQRYLDRARVILTGHEHMQRVRKETSEIGDEFLRVYAGATNPPETAGPYPYRYSWLELALHIDGDRQIIRLTVYPRVWEHSRTEFVADKNLLNSNNEFATFDLLCPSYKKPPVATTAPPNSSGSALPVAKEDVMVDEHNTQDIQRLQYFFWSYLDEWQDRIRILVDLDLLPDTKNQPVPHTLERLALDRAMSADKLYALWEAVMPHVPAPKRKPNPFPAPEGGK
ncbi:MAG: metallophosphoesterase [Dehalococcoidia bacterium]